jgi:septal ring factor EnvC (AmiA/AmiB activator)
MKTIRIKLLITSLITISSLTISAQQADKNAGGTRKDIKKAQKKSAEEKKDSASNHQEFINESKQKIKKNDEDIVQLKRKNANDKKEIQKKYHKKVLELEQKNNELRKLMDNYNEGDESKWIAFKNNLSNSLTELSESIGKISMSKE